MCKLDVYFGYLKGFSDYLEENGVDEDRPRINYVNGRWDEDDGHWKQYGKKNCYRTVSYNQPDSGADCGTDT